MTHPGRELALRLGLHIPLLLMPAARILLALAALGLITVLLAALVLYESITPAEPTPTPGWGPVLVDTATPALRPIRVRSPSGHGQGASQLRTELLATRLVSATAAGCVDVLEADCKNLRRPDWGEGGRPEHVQRWVELIVLIRSRLGLPGPDETPEAIVVAAPAEGLAAQRQPTQDRVLVVPSKLDHARYTSLGALIVDVDQQIPTDVTHVGFYVDGAIQPTIPRIEADYPGLLFSASTTAQLRATGRGPDTEVAGLIDNFLRVEDALANSTHHLLLLSTADDPSTILLDQPVQNTKQRNGKPLAWTVGPKVVQLAAIRRNPKTTEELEKFDAESS